MLKTVPISSNRKTGPIAVTYRAGMHETYSTCPTTCALHPKSATGATLIDREYFDALRVAVPKRGVAWTYSHFDAALLPVPAKGETVINASCDTVAQALRAVSRPMPRPPTRRSNGRNASRACALFVALPNWPISLLATNAGAVALYAPGASAIMSLFSLPMARGLRKSARAREAVMPRMVRPRFNGTAPKKRAQRMTPRPCAPSRPRCPWARNFGTMSRAISALAINKKLFYYFVQAQ
jgi:hypothetical protein